MNDPIYVKQTPALMTVAATPLPSGLVSLRVEGKWESSDPVGWGFTIPLTRDEATALAAQLTSGGAA